MEEAVAEDDRADLTEELWATMVVTESLAAVRKAYIRGRTARP